jgi:hypothetical protein
MPVYNVWVHTVIAQWVSSEHTELKSCCLSTLPLCWLVTLKDQNLNHYSCVGTTVDISLSGMQYATDVSIVTYSGRSIHDGTLLHSKSQYTTVKHSRKLFEHTYTSDPHGLGTLTPIEFFQQDLLWQSFNTRSHSCSQKASKHTSGQSIVGLSVHLHTTTALRRVVHH